MQFAIKFWIFSLPALLSISCGKGQGRTIRPDLKARATAVLQSPSGNSTNTLPTRLDATESREAALRTICRDGNRILMVEEGAFLTWAVVKNRLSPIVGRNKVKGYLLSPAGSFQNATLRVYLDESSTNSENEVRDERINRIVFGVDKGNPLTFELTDILSTSNKFAYPNHGDSVELLIRGVVLIAGRTTTIDVPLYFTATKEGYRISNALAPVKLDLFSDLLLGAEIKEITDLVSVTLENHVDIRFDFTIYDICTDVAQE